MRFASTDARNTFGDSMHGVGLGGGLVRKGATCDADDMGQRTDRLGVRQRCGHGHLVLCVDLDPDVGPGGHIGRGHIGHTLDDVEAHDREAFGDECTHGRGPDGPGRSGDEHHIPERRVSRHPAIITITQPVPIAPTAFGVAGRLGDGCLRHAF